MRYFIRTPGIYAGRVLGPFDPIEALQKAKLLRDSGVDYFITEEQRSIVVSEDDIKRREE